MTTFFNEIYIREDDFYYLNTQTLSMLIIFCSWSNKNKRYIEHVEAAQKKVESVLAKQIHNK